ncbi:MAG: hypothetical protein CL678_09700 [Bdellovibrionaceae bacterium]|nr:hypothetical protein [Pseudobdellovibrionaceae bacterium]
MDLSNDSKNLPIPLRSSLRRSQIKNELKQIFNAAYPIQKENKEPKREMEDIFSFIKMTKSSFHQKRLKRILSALLHERDYLSRPIKVLDFSCREGITSRAIAGLGFPTVGLDSNREKIKQASELKKRLPTLTPLHFIHSDLANAPYWERKVEIQLEGLPDVIVMENTLKNLHSIDQFLNRLFHWMKSGSFLLINEENPWALGFQIQRHLNKNKQREWNRTYGGWKTALEKSHFRLSPAAGIDLIPGIDYFLPQICSSLLFTAQKL